MNIKDKVKISGLQVETIIGCYPEERNKTQPLIIDLALGTDLSPALNSDNLKHTIDYYVVAQDIKNICKTTHFFLLEGLIQAILSHIFNHYPVFDAHISVSKPCALSDATASVECYRTRNQI
ncbi:MAG: dihydroneopterin aldolase [Endozoicomonadaceae bacterium]|nr:dihydroneopterin aldolase [Endozoicomonadaceae bacterium]MCY4330322.1 dihydroneopterin aldolase [Endozoicomonadaceae bacterium]